MASSKALILAARVKFKSLDPMYTAEKEDHKTNTVRYFAEDEESDIRKQILDDILGDYEEVNLEGNTLILELVKKDVEYDEDEDENCEKSIRHLARAWIGNQKVYILTWRQG